ncbi:MAG TPA: ATP-binding protein [Candidatus Limnocylindrales bacterium]|nr:ATP-binding protein [Candidatus Limnocylindrales bacterium]
MPSESARSWRSLICPQDFVWLLLFGALVASPDQRYADAPEILPLIALGIAQILEPKVPALGTRRGRIAWIVLKLALAYTLIGETGTFTSRYWLMLLLPVVSAATALGVAGTLGFTVLAAGAYLSFLVWTADWLAWLPELLYRVIFLAMAGNLANTLAEDLRVQSRKHRRTAEQLAEANAHLREAEEAVRRSDRLAALGQLSAGLAHELRNPLATIRNSSEMLTRSIGGQNELAAEMAGFIASEVDRANSLVTRFLQFARPLEIRPDTADLHHALDVAIAMVEREAPGISIYRNYAPEIPPFPFDAELLERVFYNLVLNAAQATEPGGAVTVKTRAAAGFAEVAVIDRGSGIDPKHMDTIFNPFFTTKPQGVGLGLAIVSKIVDEHGGKIAVESEPGKGSIFRVLLPMQQSPVSA